MTTSLRDATPGAGPAADRRFTVTRKSFRQVVVVRAAAGAGATAGQFDVVKVAVRAGAKRGKSQAAVAATRVPTAAELRDVLGILARRTAQPVVALAGGIPMKTCVAPDVKSSAKIPDLPGSECDGAQGSFSTSKPGYGAATLGLPIYVTTVPTPGGTPITATFTTPEQALRDVFPQVTKTYFGTTTEITATTAIPGTENILPGIPSQLIAFHAKLLGREFDGIALSAYLDASTGGLTWLWYASYVLVDTKAPPGTGEVYLTTWRTWDNRPAIKDRLANIAATLGSITPAGGPIDPDAFQRAADNWGAFIAS